MSRYGVSSIRMLHFLNEKPAATSGEINDHLHGGATIVQQRVRYKTVPWKGPAKTHVQWQSKSYVQNNMVKSKYYWDLEILDERERLVSKVCRGRFAYLLSPYYSRTLSADTRGSRPHPSSVNRRSQRCWFYRRKIDGKFRYFLTLRGLAAIAEFSEEM